MQQIFDLKSCAAVGTSEQVGRKQPEGFLPRLLPPGSRPGQSPDATRSRQGRTPLLGEQLWLCTAQRAFLHSSTMNSQEEPQ